MSDTCDLVLQIYRAAREATAAEYPERVLALLRPHLPFASDRWLADVAAGRMHGLSLYRTSEDDGFGPSQKRLLESLLPHLQEALTHNRLLCLRQAAAAASLAAGALSLLTPREQSIAGLYGKGLSHKDIARRLDISPATVRNFIQRIFAKLGVCDKAELSTRIGGGHPMRPWDKDEAARPALGLLQ